MVGLALGVAWLGYATFYYGLTQVQGGNWGFLDLIVPSRWTEATAATPRDDGSTLGSTTAAKATSATSTAPNVSAPGTPGINAEGGSSSGTGVQAPPVPSKFTSPLGGVTL
jgi:hypothetical protein